MQMQYKFTSRESLKQSLIRKLIKFILFCFLFVAAIFVLDKFDFPSPEKKINKEITDEVVKLK